LDRVKERSFEEPGGEGMSEDGDYMDGYNDGFIDGRGTMLKPLRWRTGPVEDRGARYLIQETQIPKGFLRIITGWRVHETDKWIPASDILDLIGGE